MELLDIEGPPRCGKGSLINDLTRILGFIPRLPMSVELGKLPEWTKIEEKTKEGYLAPDEIVVPVLRRALEALVGQPHKYALLDGAVRTKAQAEELLKVCKEQGWKIKVLALYAPDEKLRERGEKRTKERAAQGLDPREDDAPEIFERRLQIFKKETIPAIGHLAENGAERYQIDGSGTPEEAFQQVFAKLDLEGAKT